MDKGHVTEKRYPSKTNNRSFIKWRYGIAMLGFLAMTTSYTMRSHLSVTLVAMVDSSNVAINNQTNSSSTGENGEFKWNQKLQGIVNSAFYYGYILPQVVGGRLAEKYSPRWVVFCGGLLGTIATLIGPIAARIHVSFFIISRVLCGLGLGVFHPCLHSLIAHWAPPYERNIFSAIIYSGDQFGVVLAMPIAGILCNSNIVNNWSWSFYVFGLAGVVWLISWLIFVYKSPSEHPWISVDERNYIESHLDTMAKFKHNLPVPWKQIFSSKSFWGLILCHFGYNWSFYTLLTELPSYLKFILNFTLTRDGWLSCLPYLLTMIIGYLSSYVAFQVTKRKLLPLVVVRKGLNTIAFYGSGLSLLIIAYLGSEIITIYCMLIVAVGFLGLTYAGFQINHIDLSPNYAGTLQGITNSIACIPGIVSPYIVGVITVNNETQNAWNIVFYTSVVILFFTGTWYLIFGSANLKPWNDLTETLVEKQLQKSLTNHRPNISLIYNHSKEQK